MRYSILACFVLVFWSCELDYEDNERLLVKGNVNRGSDTAFPTLPIEIFASDGGGFFRSGIERIGVGEVKIDGTFDIVTISPKNPKSLELLINERSQIGYLPDYSSLTIIGFDFLELDDATYNISEGFIEKLINARFLVKRVENKNDSLNYSFRYQNSNQIINYLQLENIYVGSNQIFGSGTITAEQTEETIAFTDLMVNDTLHFEYTIVKKDTMETGETRFVLNAETNEYVFEF